MIRFEAVIELVGGVKASELRYWIAEGWVRPEVRRGEYLFREIDVARARLIHELDRELAIHRDSIPVVLHLLDQLFAMRRRVRAMEEAIEAQPAAVRRSLRGAVGKRPAPADKRRTRR